MPLERTSNSIPRDFLSLVATLMALMALAIDLPLPAFPQMRAAFGLPPDSNLVGQSITYFFLGMSVPQVVYGPISDRFGRKPVLFFGLAVYALGATGSALATTLPALLISRFIWGVGAAANRVVIVAMVRDCYSGERMARFMSLVFALFVMVPVFAPSLGSLLLMVSPWRSVYWFCLLFVAVVALWSYLRLPETLPEDRRIELRLRPVGRAIGRVFTTRVTVTHTLAGTVLMASFTSYLASSELIVSGVFSRPAQFPIVFGVVASAAGLGSLLNGKLVMRYGIYTSVRRALLCYVLFAGLLAVVALSSGGRPNFWLWYPLLTAVVGCYMLLFPNFNTMALGPLGAIAGTASAVTGALSTAVAAALGALLDRAMNGTVLPLSLGWLGGGLAAALLFAVSGVSSAAGRLDKAPGEAPAE